MSLLHEYVFRVGGRDVIVHAASQDDAYDQALLDAEERGLLGQPHLIDSYPWDPSGGDGPDD